MSVILKQSIDKINKMVYYISVNPGGDIVTNVIDHERLGGVLLQATAEHWNKEIPAHIPISLMIAINSLKSAIPRFWEKDVEHTISFLNQNSGVKKIFAETKDTLLAFAIRQARM
jgi:hypothetical protein